MTAYTDGSSDVNRPSAVPVVARTPIAASLRGDRPDWLVAIALACTAVALFAVMEALVKSVGTRVPVIEIAWARYVVHTGVMVLALGPSRGSALIRTARPGFQLARATLLVAVTLLNWIALQFLPLAEVTAAVQVGPLLVTAFAFVGLRERVTWAQWAAVLVGLGGVLLLLRPGAQLASALAALPLGTAVCYSLYQIMTRSVGRTDSASTTLFYTALIGTALLTPAVPAIWVTPSGGDLAAMTALGLVAVLAHTAFIAAFSRAPASVLAPYSYTQVVWATVLGALVFRSVPDPLTFGAIGLILLAGVSVARMASHDLTGPPRPDGHAVHHAHDSRTPSVDDVRSRE